MLERAQAARDGNVDYNNHLPRGASYARSGHLKDTKISGNQIMARVAVSCSMPYKETIIVPQFFKEQVELLMTKDISYSCGGL